MNNPKGKLEIDGIKALGFDLIYKKDGIEKDMSEGIKLFNEKRLSASNAADYGLEVKNFGQFKGLIMSQDAAFRIFGVNSYASRQFWKKEGPICKAAMSVELSSLKEAISFFQKSLEMRTRNCGDSGHDHMRINLETCVAELERCEMTRTTGSAVARGTRGLGGHASYVSSSNVPQEDKAVHGSSMLGKVAGLALVVGMVIAFNVVKRK